MNPRELWERYRRWLCEVEPVGLRLDVSRMRFDEAFIAGLEAPMQRAFDAMEAIERGAVANISEQRQVGHYWLRAAHLAPSQEQRRAIERTVEDIVAFAAEVRAGRLRPSSPEAARGFGHVLLIGIGGSALGPQLVCDALCTPADPVKMHFIDNTDPDGIARVVAELGDALAETLVIVVSKSGSTVETRNGMLEVQHAFRQRGLDFAGGAVAVTGEGSALDRAASSEGWLRRFPMWDWVGGRTSVTSAVGLLPAALAGIDVRRLLAGAAACDQATRAREPRRNPAALLSAMWHYAGRGRGERAMVVLPYRDRLLLFPRYLQQLVMESLGKEKTRDGRIVEQGLTVYGNKGSTDQHAFVQQLRDGRNDFFVTFIDVLEDSGAPGLAVEPDTTSGDYLLGFLLGTRQALWENGRESITITLPRIDAFTLGALIALFERAVGLYAELIDVNAYDQPGVEAGKRAAGAVIALQREVLACVRAGPADLTAERIAEALGRRDDVETIHHILQRLSARAFGQATTPPSPGRGQNEGLRRGD